MYRNLIIGLGALYLALFAISASVTRRLRRQSQLNARLAQYDTLTGLPNRSLFEHQASAALQAARRHGESMAIAVVDLDRFKEINDTLGHRNGNEVLTEVGRRLAEAARAGHDGRPPERRRVRSRRPLQDRSRGRPGRDPAHPRARPRRRRPHPVGSGQHRLRARSRRRRRRRHADAPCRRRHVPRQGRACRHRPLRRASRPVRRRHPGARRGAAAGHRFRAARPALPAPAWPEHRPHRRVRGARALAAPDAGAARCPTRSCRWPSRPT